MQWQPGSSSNSYDSRLPEPRDGRALGVSIVTSLNPGLYLTLAKLGSDGHRVAQRVVTHFEKPDQLTCRYP
jgi:hypothetical protein